MHFPPPPLSRAGSQAQTHGGLATNCGNRPGHTSSNPATDYNMGGELGATSLRAIPSALLYGFTAVR